MDIGISSPVFLIITFTFIVMFIGLVLWATTHGVDYKSTPKNERERHEFFDDYPN